MGLNNEVVYDLVTVNHTASIDSYHGGTSDFSGAYDLNEILQLSSSNTNVLDVGVTGKPLWHSTTGASLSTTVTAKVLNAVNATLTSSATVSVNPAPIRQLVKVQIFPRNRKYTLNSPSTSEYYFMLAFYDDETVVDVSSQATWSTDGGSTGAYFNTQDPGTPNLLATFGGQTDTTGLEVLSN